jgi:hypothetical protein
MEQRWPLMDDWAAWKTSDMGDNGMGEIKTVRVDICPSA